MSWQNTRKSSRYYRRANTDAITVTVYNITILPPIDSIERKRGLIKHIDVIEGALRWSKSGNAKSNSCDWQLLWAQQSDAWTYLETCPSTRQKDNFFTPSACNQSNQCSQRILHIWPCPGDDSYRGLLNGRVQLLKNLIYAQAESFHGFKSRWRPILRFIIMFYWRNARSQLLNRWETNPMFQPCRISDRSIWHVGQPCPKSC